MLYILHVLRYLVPCGVMINLTRKLVATQNHTASHRLDKQSSCSPGHSSPRKNNSLYESHKVLCCLLWRGQNENCLKRETDNRTNGKESENRKDRSVQHIQETVPFSLCNASDPAPRLRCALSLTSGLL
jgi:hypothetical protein